MQALSMRPNPSSADTMPVHAPEPVFGRLPALGPTMADVSVQPNAERCRHEFRQAIDHGNDADVVVWARRWGESLTARAYAHGKEY